MSEWVLSKQPCPVCPSSDAFHVHADGHGYCFSCQHFQPSDKGVEFNLDDNTFTYEYLPLRGINRSVLEFYDVKTKIDKDGKPIAIGFRYPSGGYKIRSLLEKDFQTKGAMDGKAGLFGQDRFSAGASRYITISEGELDALSLYQATGGPVVSVRSASSAVNDCANARSFLNSFERIYLAFDNDPVGRAATADVAKLFDYSKVYDVKFTKRKDANEYLQHGEQEELKKIWWNSKQYLPDTIVSSFDDFKDILTTGVQEGIRAYPTSQLNNMLYGVRTGEAVLYVAQEKVGKTELMHATAYNLLVQTDCPIALIFLEEPKQRLLQALAGIHLKKRVHLPDSGVTPLESFDALREVVRQDDRLHVYSNFGSDDPDVFLDLVRYLVVARGCRYVLFDHLSMVVSGDKQTEGERKRLDYLSTRLEMMVKELGFSLICVSHVNDEGKTRGSRNLTKVFDITIGAERDLQHWDPVERRTIHLRVLFNRFSSETGPAGKLIYSPITGCLEEPNDGKASNDNTEAVVLSAA